MIRLLFLLLAFAPIAAAQQGTIHYEVKTRLDIELPPEMQAMADQFPKETTQQLIVHFTPSATLSMPAPRDPEADNRTSRNGRVRFMMGGARSDDRTFFDLDEGKMIEKKDFLGRTFLIEGEPQPLPWRLTTERSAFLGYDCQKAVAVRDSSTYEAWFTTQILASVGPEEFGGLPGAILVLTMDDGKKSYVATSVSLEPVDPNLLVPPTEGQRVTKAEFDAIVAEKIEEMQAARGSGRGRSFTIRQ
jgi:GLPGLI family protein